MKERSLEQVNKGGVNLIFESKNEVKEHGLILKFNFRKFPKMIDVMLNKKDADTFLEVKKLFEDKDPALLENLPFIKDELLKKEILAYYNGAYFDLEKITNDSVKYLKDTIFDRYNEYIKETQKDYDNIYSFFGKENVEGIKFFCINKENVLKIDKEEAIGLLNMMYPPKEKLSEDDWGKIKDFVLQNNIEIPIIFQGKFSFDKENLRSFQNWLPSRENFEKIIKENEDINLVQELQKIFKKNFEDDIYELIDVDKNLTKAVSDFVGKTIKYTKSTHKFIDFFGHDNVLFYKENDIVKYKLLDPVVNIDFSSDNSNMKVDDPKEFIKNNLDGFRHYYFYTKSLNKFAEKLGLEERLTAEDIFGTRIQGVEKEINEFIK